MALRPPGAFELDSRDFAIRTGPKKYELSQKKVSSYSPGRSPPTAKNCRRRQTTAFYGFRRAGNSHQISLHLEARFATAKTHPNREIAVNLKSRSLRCIYCCTAGVTWLMIQQLSNQQLALFRIIGSSPPSPLCGGSGGFLGSPPLLQCGDDRFPAREYEIGGRDETQVPRRSVAMRGDALPVCVT
jgi:hypothetical protein